MVMNKVFLIGLVLLILTATVFAAGSINSILSYNAGYNSASNQLVVNMSCKSMVLATISLSNGESRDLICSTIGLDESMLLNGDVENLTSLTTTITIPTPCDVCTLNKTVMIKDNSSDNLFSTGNIILGIILFILLLVGLWVVSKLKKG